MQLNPLRQRISLEARRREVLEVLVPALEVDYRHWQQKASRLGKHVGRPDAADPRLVLYARERRNLARRMLADATEGLAILSFNQET